MSEYFPEPKYWGGKVKVESDLSNYVTKTDSQNATRIDTLSLIVIVFKVNLASLKSDVHKLDIDKLKNLPTNLNKSR